MQTATWAAEQSAALFKAGAIAEQENRAAQQAVVAAQAAVAASEARLRTASAVAGDTRVLAPTSGIIDIRSVQPGERVSVSTPLFTLVRNETLELAANVPARMANLVQPGQTVRLSVDDRGHRVARRPRQSHGRSGLAQRHRLRACPECERRHQGQHLLQRSRDR
ncbi:MAG: HlyD family efflux transporter periplasmic adaptor subunit [Gemmatimonadaceae bacterium]|nr:HlyD family efflux transporter periplasmic adaptor subunit [Gemmatimonadaceae bacterium]